MCVHDKVHWLLLQELRVKGHTPKERVYLEMMQITWTVQRVLAQELKENRVRLG